MLQTCRQPWWSERPVITQRFELNAAKHLVINGCPPHISFCQLFLPDVRHANREWLGRCCPITSKLLLRNRPLFYIGDRLTGFPIEHENVPGFRNLDQRRQRPSFTIWNVIQRRLGRDVIVPNIVMDGLVCPTFASRVVVQRDD
ncbi:hypothetical protein D3C86_1558070 [compost metagenome]